MPIAGKVRVVVLDLNPEPLKDSVAEDAGGAVAGVDHEYVVTGGKPAHQDDADRGQPAFHHHGAGRGIDLGQGRFECAFGWC